jgi:hypothetical protein
MNPASAVQYRRDLVYAYACRYVRAGWRLIHNHHIYRDGCTCHDHGACGRAGKHPRIEQWSSWGATADLSRIRRWILRDPYLNLGLVTGQGILVLDIDPGQGGDRWMARHQASLPPTLQQQSGSNGTHLFYRVPSHYHIKTTNRGQLAPGVDTRGDGGQIIVAPSRNLHGLYHWVINHTPWDRAPTMAPVRLLTLLEEHQILMPRVALQAPASDPPPHSVSRCRPVSDVILQKYLALAHPGTRNEYGFHLAQQLRDNGYGIEEAEAYLLQYQRQVDDPRNRYTENEARASLRSAYRYPQRAPWSPR